MIEKLHYPTTPPRDYQTCKEEHIANGRNDKFIAYERAGTNRFTKQILYLRQHGVCPVCKKFLISAEDSGNQVHHTTYDRVCTSLSPSTPLVKAYCPRKNGHVYKMTANCELCYYDHPERAENCLATLVMVHTDCHALLHNKLAKS